MLSGCDECPAVIGEIRSENAMLVDERHTAVLIKNRLDAVQCEELERKDNIRDSWVVVDVFDPDSTVRRGDLQTANASQTHGRFLGGQKNRDGLGQPGFKGEKR
jgi:hypothetical protein